MDNKRKLWYGWAKQAQEHFRTSRKTIHNRYKHADPDLMQFIDKQIAERKKAVLIKESIDFQTNN